MDNFIAGYKAFIKKTTNMVAVVEADSIQAVEAKIYEYLNTTDLPRAKADIYLYKGMKIKRDRSGNKKALFDRELVKTIQLP
jgi:hypothetical protein